eukprot:c11248_g1_i1.p1 GENE.c11248_g1_i1~~c11248_g1_i1.p1  ORF type:complete len:137 (-),score=20.58 c11248_g1_i1:37-447(-)
MGIPFQNCNRHAMSNKSAAFLLLGAAAAGVATYAFYEINKKKRSDCYPRASSDEQLQQAVQEYMGKELENLMITFKREVPHGTFVEFLISHFPENVKFENGVPQCDERVNNDSWLGRFQRVRAEDSLHQLSHPPTE